MKLLLYTHVLLWWLGRPRALSDDVRARIRDPENLVFASVVSAWEMEIKRALGKLRAPDDLGEQLRRHRIAELPLRLTHVHTLRALPAVHRDPFDRMLIAQAVADELTVLTRDRRFGAYPVKLLAV